MVGARNTNTNSDTLGCRDRPGAGGGSALVVRALRSSVLAPWLLEQRAPFEAGGSAALTSSWIPPLPLLLKLLGRGHTRFNHNTECAAAACRPLTPLRPPPRSVRRRYVNLKHAGGEWDETLCAAHFPTTCSLFKGLPEVDGTLSQASVEECAGYCPMGPVQPGMIAFYRLGAGRTVPLHNGGSNQRLKCHLVVSAPPAEGPHPAYITAGVDTKFVDTGDTFCFDDSYIHAVHNGGGAEKDLTRVVLDVALWHPLLKLV